MPSDNTIDRVLLLLLGGVVFFTAMLFVCEVWFKDDGILFTTVSGILSGFTGSFFTRLKPREVPPSLPLPGPSSSVDASVTVHQDPKSPKENQP